MRFDWLSFVEKQRITYVTKSPNVARGHIAIRCPFCGGSDPSQHMGLCLDVGNPVWGCLRDRRHRGRNPTWLVMRLLGCGASTAREIVDAGKVAYGDDMAKKAKEISPNANPGFKIARWLDKQHGNLGETWHPVDGSKIADYDAKLDTAEDIKLPRDIRPIDGRGYSKKFVEYLVERGFANPWLAVDAADLHYAVTGNFKYRLVFPIRVDGVLVSFTARDITNQSPTRYLTLPSDDEVISIKHCLYMEDRIAAGGDVLFLCEGPVDALKMNCYMRPGYAATCFFGMPTAIQLAKLLYYAPRWRAMCPLLDPDVPMQRLALHYGLSSTARLVPAFLPQGADDPGALTPDQVRLVMKGVLHNFEIRASVMRPTASIPRTRRAWS
jgi:hypothetical protein